MIIDLSIDFDYFVREPRHWDFGHAEVEPFIRKVWPARYAQYDLWRETNPEVYADVPPLAFTAELKERGVRFHRSRNLGIADSHRFALPFLLKKSERAPADHLLHFDAHHDCYGGDRVTCENWLSHYMDQRTETKVTWVQPQWLEGKSDHDDLPSPLRGRHIDFVTELKELQLQGMVRNVFLCRSSAWTPPHLDPLFGMLVTDLLNRAKVRLHVMENISDRHLAVPPRT